MHDLEVAIGTGGLAAKKHGCLLALQSAITDHVEKQLRNDKRPKKLHYIFETETPQSPAKPLQNLIVLKEIAADCRRWVLQLPGLRGGFASPMNWLFQMHT